tara:strand:- start:2 stop:1504 length:1503 start_codon:yes stop_codon:yes gene_type:complete
MAKAEVKALLNEVIANISKKTSAGKDAYRKFKSDKKVHKIHLSVKETQLQVEKEMYFREGIEKHGKVESRVTGAKHSKKALKLLDKIIAEESRELVHTFHKKFSKSKGTKYYASKLGKDKNNFTVVYAVIEGSKAQKSGDFNVFDNFKQVKQDLQKPMVKALNDWARVHSVRDTSQVESTRKDKKYKGRKDTPGVRYEDGTKITMVSKEIQAQGAGFLDIGHMEGSSVSAQKALDASEKLWELDASFKNNRVAQKFLTEMQAELKWFIKKSDKKGKLSDTVEVGLESKAFNRDVESKKEALQLEVQLQKVLADLGADRWADFGGSDSMREKIEKTVLNQLHKSVKGGKGIKTNFRHQKIKYSNAKHKGKPIKPKVVKAVLAVNQARTVKKPKKVRTKRAGPSNAPLFLLGILNEQLPQTVEANMGAPALTNRTGRFAGSPRVTDVISTPEGFPSFGYTYQRDPYGTFEDDHDYDPRRLIDRSMREIAAEYAIGRFYTRRV